MTNEEAKEYFVMRLKDSKYANGRYTRQREAFEMAIKALEKQIPKKPIDKGRDLTYCPTCSRTFWYCGRVNFCQYCGQALDWSEE